MVPGQSLSSENSTLSSVIPPDSVGHLVVTYSKAWEAKKNSGRNKSCNELTDRLASADFSDFEFLGRLGYNGGMNVAYCNSELKEVAEEKKVIMAQHFVYTGYNDISIWLGKIFSDMKEQNKIDKYDPLLSYAYAHATQKILETMTFDDCNQDVFTEVYFVFAQPNKSPPGVNGSHFESEQIRMFLLKYNPPKPSKMETAMYT